MEPTWDADLDRYVWGPPASPVPPPPIEPAFIREAVASDFEPRPGVTTFADTYPHGGPGSLTVAEPPAEDFDALADWRVPGEVADEVLISLPEGTPRMLRTLLTLLLGAMRGRPADPR